VHQRTPTRTRYLREFLRPARYNSPDCPVYTGQCPVLQGSAASGTRQPRETGGSRSAIIHRTVRCTPDCPVCQRSNGYFAPTVDSDSKQCGTVLVAEVRAEIQRGTGLSGAAPDCPVPHEDKASNGRPAPISTDRMTWLTHRTCPVCTGLSGAPIASRLHQRLVFGWWL
jgi:hypothetical protein